MQIQAQLENCDLKETFENDYENKSERQSSMIARWSKE